MIPAEIIVRDIPLSEGTLFALVNFEPGPPVQGSLNMPAAMKGTKWPDVSTWAVLYWRCGVCYAACLKSENGRPWDLESVRDHFDRLGLKFWMQVATNKGTA